MCSDATRSRQTPSGSGPDAAARPEAQAPKGRPTPSRKEAETSAAHRSKIPTDPKEAKKAPKERARAERATARAGMVSGDERYLPARDAGPVRAYVRDYVDGRRRMSEYFVFVAVGILLAGFLRDPQVQTAVSFIWFGATAVIAVEMVCDPGEAQPRAHRALARQGRPQGRACSTAGCAPCRSASAVLRR